MKRQTFWLALPLWAALTAPAAADALKAPPKVPAPLQFVRSLDVESFAQETNDHDTGAQTFRVRTRYLDPDYDAFVGLLAGFTRWNLDMIYDATTQDRANDLWTWGADIGIRRGIHLWETDILGAVMGGHLGPGLAFVGEHDVARRLVVFHRTELDFFVGNTAVDQDQGLTWRWRDVGLEGGYRFFAAQHAHRSGPHLGVTWRFESPNLPFMFPSMG
ncbi:MAG TPA: hypothetical protein VMU17_00360 [Elusimicrobiota bacterium]|nr:hypothetical protein [Elusimicrobiota bacterium]